MSPRRVSGLRRRQRFPRVSGDEPGLLDLWSQIYLFSPRERG